MTKPKQPSVISAQKKRNNRQRLSSLIAEMRNNPLLAIDMHEALGDAIPTMTFPELYTEAVYDDREWYPVMRCPRCKVSLGEGDIVAVDVSIRETECGEVDADNSEVHIEYDETEDYVGLYYKHNGCGPISLPDRWEVNH